MSNFQRYEPQSEEINRKATEDELANVPRMTQKAMLEVMRSPDYKRSKLAQELIAASLAKGLLNDDGSEPQPEVVGEEGQRLSGDEIAAKHSHFRKLFSNPAYKHDAGYRREVHEKLKGLTVGDAPVDDNALSTPNKVVRVSLSPFAHEAARVESLGVHRETARTTDHVGPENPVKRVVKEPFSD